MSKQTGELRKSKKRMKTICPRCNKRPKADISYCRECRIEYERKWRMKNKERVNANKRVRSKVLQKERLLKGLCGKCERPLVSKFFCQKHLDKQRELSKRMREKRHYNKGVCYVCGGKVSVRSSWYCEKCRLRRNKLKNLRYRELKAERALAR